MASIYRRDGDADPDTQTPATPPSPGSYWFPLLLVVLICAGYLVWRRRNHHYGSSLGSREYPQGPAALRLSMDDDGPAATSFIMNNESNESLPSHALSDLPVLPDPPQSGGSLHPAYQDRPSSSLGSYASTPDVSGMPSTGLSRAGSSSRIPGEGYPFPNLQASETASGPGLSRGTTERDGRVASGRRSIRAKMKSPVEGGDSSESEDDGLGADRDVFGIGDDAEETGPRAGPL